MFEPGKFKSLTDYEPNSRNRGSLRQETAWFSNWGGKNKPGKEKMGSQRILDVISEKYHDTR